MGRYLISPMTRLRPDARYSASVSIRSGSGSGTHDRVLRLTPLFDDPAQAAHFALRQGLAWLAARDATLASPQPA
jgi:hypothetical protein